MPDSIRGRLCGAPLSTSLTLKQKTCQPSALIRIARVPPGWSLGWVWVVTGPSALPVVPQRLHVHIDGGGVWPSRALLMEIQNKTHTATINT